LLFVAPFFRGRDREVVAFWVLGIEFNYKVCGLFCNRAFSKMQTENKNRVTIVFQIICFSVEILIL